PRPTAPPAQTATTINSLTALATATEPAVERKPAVVAPPSADHADRQRKEPRLANPAPQLIAKTDAQPQEAPSLVGEDQQRMMAGDGSQRPQRWGFWRGNR